MNVKLTKDDAQEVLHKLSIVVDSPDLLTDYAISQEHARRLVESVPVNGGEWDVSSEWARKARFFHPERKRVCQNAR